MTIRTEDIIDGASAATLDALFRERVRRTPSNPAYRWFERRAQGWQTLTWAEIACLAARWRQALASEGLAPGDRIAVLARNSPDWVALDQAALALGLVTVPLYLDDRPDNAAFIVRDAEAKVLAVQDAGRWKRLAPALADSPWPERVLLLDAGGESSAQDATDPRVRVVADWLPVETGDPAVTAADVPGVAKPDDLATIVYTSGTTGRPKGVMLSHRNILSNVQATLTLLTAYREDLFLSFLPLSHMLERTGGYYLPMATGGSVAYARSIAQLSDDLRQLRPTVLIAVPRVFERVYQRIVEQLRARPPLARRLFALAVKTGWIAFERRQGRRGWHPLFLIWPLLRRLVAAPVLTKLGGRVRAAVSGGAPLSPDVARLFLGLELPLLQGYGMTEASPVISVNSLENNIPSSVGLPLPGLELRLGADDELLVRGPSVMQGYWNRPEDSARALDADGWLHTGDRARIDGRHLFITGRIKDILILSNGEKVPPADMEMAIGLEPLCEQVMVIGEGQSYLSALMVLDAERWRELATEQALDPEAPASLADARVQKIVLTRVRAALRDFPGYAKIRRVTLLREPWSIDNGLLTPTLKIKRGAILERYRAEVEAMYRLDERGEAD